MARWKILGAHLIRNRLEGEPDEVKSAVLEGIELLLENPYEPPGPVEVHVMRGRNPEGLYVAYLPDNWYLSYVPRPDFPPIGREFIEVRALHQRVI